jgi:hypothetical protein
MKNLWTLAFCFAATGLTCVAKAEDLGGIKIGASVDLIANFGPEQKQRLDVREAEFSFFAPIDSNFFGLLSVAAHQEASGAFFEIHEAYVSANGWIPATRFKLGKFFLGVGRLNQFHRHEWPMISAPRVQKEYFDAEAISDTGLEMSWMLPINSPVELTAGLSNGWTYGHSHNIGTRPQTPLHYLRTSWFDSTLSSAGSDWGTLVGLNYLKRTNADGLNMMLLGIDLTLKEKFSRLTRWLWQNEVWYRILKSPTITNSSSWGSYSILQHALSEQYYLGLTFDSLNILKLQNSIGQSISDNELATGPIFTIKFSEFSKFRASYQFAHLKKPAYTTNNHIIELQFNYILGAHPAHDF